MKISDAKIVSKKINRGLEIFVDAEDSDLLLKRWSAAKTGRQQTEYAYSSEGSRVCRKMFMLHRVIASRILGREIRRDEVVDHRNGNGLDNQRSNMRIVSQKENCAHRVRADRRNKSGYRGVCWSKQRGKWVAQATFSKKHIYLGLFDEAIDAAKVSHDWRLENMPGYLPYADPYFKFTLEMDLECAEFARVRAFENTKVFKMRDVFEFSQGREIW